ncbi:hypothetical protein [Lolliginicoccus suaedae]|uniref:hypothetical protein n=1 Tax=Lolliginicoccus suaedae TaxID=2605429 RepID=UPI0011EE7729|nr:hypothetical protein [Lolliginicoccus suaedae]
MSWLEIVAAALFVAALLLVVGYIAAAITTEARRRRAKLALPRRASAWQAMEQSARPTISIAALTAFITSFLVNGRDPFGEIAVMVALSGVIFGWGGAAVLDLGASSRGWSRRAVVAGAFVMIVVGPVVYGIAKP